MKTAVLGYGVKISIAINQGDHIYVLFTRLDCLQRRPVAHTCTFTLEISCTYQSFPEFREEFNSILEANTWEMDIV